MHFEYVQVSHVYREKIDYLNNEEFYTIEIKGIYMGSTEEYPCKLLLYRPVNLQEDLYIPHYIMPIINNEWCVKTFLQWDDIKEKWCDITNLFSSIFLNQVVNKLSPLIDIGEVG